MSCTLLVQAPFSRLISVLAACSHRAIDLSLTSDEFATPQMSVVGFAGPTRIIRQRPAEFWTVLLKRAPAAEL